jgi:TetR/AcrR family transcriptional repressor of nem operon
MEKKGEKQDARQRIIEAAAALVHAQGFRGAGLQEILDRAKVPKGSFYYYFKNKEELGAALVDHFADQMAQGPGALLRDASLPPLDRLCKFLERLRELFMQRGCRLGCPLGNLALEMSDASELVRRRTAAAFRKLSATMAGVLTEAQVRGDIRKDVDCDAAADFTVNALEGCLLRMKAERDPSPLALCEAIVLDWLKTPAGAEDSASAPAAIDNKEN